MFDLSYANMDGVPTQTAGTSELLASDWNTYVRDNFDAIKFGHIVCTSSTRPTGIAEGTMIYETDTNKVFVYNGGWVEIFDLDNIGAVSTIAEPYLAPTGSLMPYAGINEPNGWLFCNGSDVSRSTYSKLFDTFASKWTTATTTNSSTTVSGLSGMVSGTHVGWGIAGSNIPSGATISSVTNSTTVVISAAATGTSSGNANIAISPYSFTGANNTTTFLLPDLRNRAVFGRDNMGNADTSRITSTSGITGTRLGANGGSQLLQSHSHDSTTQVSTFSLIAGGTAAPGLIEAPGTRAVTGTAGSGGSQNMPPTLILNYIIKT